jgi:hypothetical protein
MSPPSRRKNIAARSEANGIDVDLATSRWQPTDVAAADPMTSTKRERSDTNDSLRKKRRIKLEPEDGLDGRMAPVIGKQRSTRLID